MPVSRADLIQLVPLKNLKWQLSAYLQNPLGSGYILIPVAISALWKQRWGWTWGRWCGGAGVGGGCFWLSFSFSLLLCKLLTQAESYNRGKRVESTSGGLARFGPKLLTAYP